jgi:hypothetical protein
MMMMFLTSSVLEGEAGDREQGMIPTIRERPSSVRQEVANAIFTVLMMQCCILLMLVTAEQ